MDTIQAEIKKIDVLLNQSITIPYYQRPYRWTATNVQQLLNDVYQSWKSGKKTYRIGSAIFHTKAGDFDLVDGQQRITTLLLVFRILKSSVGEELRKKIKYNHTDSFLAIRENNRVISSWIAENINNEKEDFSNYLSKHCEFVEIRVEDLSEAFQMFDSQNGRGRELEAYNLLKAFHIRAMEVNSFEEKIESDRKWESSTRFLRDNNVVFDVLNQLFKEQLFRTRLWSRKETAYAFDKLRISEYKGFTINKDQSLVFSHQNSDLLHYVVEQYFEKMGVSVKGIKSRFKLVQKEGISPFTLINQRIINGKPFFSYINTYVEIYKELYESDNPLVLPEFKRFIRSESIVYDGSNRDGDKYLFELYKSLILLIFDKFGEEGVDRYFKTIYALVYRLRLEKQQVKYNFVADYPVTEQLHHIIENAKSFADLQSLEQSSFRPIECKKEIPTVIKFMNEHNVKLFTTDANIDLKKYGPNGN